MPTAPAKPCMHPRCAGSAAPGARWCALHQPIGRAAALASAQAHDARRGNASARGYDSKWKKQSAVFKDRFPLCYGVLVPTVAWNEARARELHALRLAAQEAGTLHAWHAEGGPLDQWLSGCRIFTFRRLIVPSLVVVVDHIVPHKGDLHLFWSEWNWQGLDERSHNRKTGQHDRGAWGAETRPAGGSDGAFCL